MGRLFALLGLTAPKMLVSVGAPVGSDTPPTAAKPVDATQLMQRHQKLKADLDKMIAKGYEDLEEKIPPQAAVEAARKLIDYRKIKIDHDAAHA